MSKKEKRQEEPQEEELYLQYLEKNYRIMQLEQEIEQIFYQIYSNPVGLKKIVDSYKLMPVNACGKYTCLSLKKTVPPDMAKLLSKNFYEKEHVAGFEPICLLGHINFSDKEKKILELYNFEWQHKNGYYIQT